MHRPSALLNTPMGMSAIKKRGRHHATSPGMAKSVPGRRLDSKLALGSLQLLRPVYATSRFHVLQPSRKYPPKRLTWWPLTQVHLWRYYPTPYTTPHSPLPHVYKMSSNMLSFSLSLDNLTSSTLEPPCLPLKHHPPPVLFLSYPYKTHQLHHAIITSEAPTATKITSHLTTLLRNTPPSDSRCSVETKNIPTP